MLPRVSDMRAPAPLHTELTAELRLRGFEGDLAPAYRRPDRLGDRQLDLPAASAACRVSAQRRRPGAHRACRGRAALRGHRIAPRGGGTGTNGQSLTDGLVVDLSRHMNAIIEINVEERWARVEAGVVKDQLNAALAEHGLFFPPELSHLQPRHHRRHDQHRRQRPGLLPVRQDARPCAGADDGVARRHGVAVAPLDDDELRQVQRRSDRVGAVHRLVDASSASRRELIAAHFPKLNRCLTGYDLAHIRDDRGRFNLNAILCGGGGHAGLHCGSQAQRAADPQTHGSGQRAL